MSLRYENKKLHSLQLYYYTKFLNKRMFFKGQDMLLTCFQSRNDEQSEVPLEIVYNPEISVHSLQVLFVSYINNYFL